MNLALRCGRGHSWAKVTRAPGCGGRMGGRAVLIVGGDVGGGPDRPGRLTCLVETLQHDLAVVLSGPLADRGVEFAATTPATIVVRSASAARPGRSMACM
jgi:hypothetical protein